MRFIACLLPVALAVGCSGTRPSNLGVHGGRLASCPPTPNCVSSQAAPSDTEHYIEPLRLDGSVDVAMERLVAVLADMPRMEVIERSETYLYVEATSFLFRFVDDVEFLFSEDQGVIHCRSASRLGQSDLGAPRPDRGDPRSTSSSRGRRGLRLSGRPAARPSGPGEPGSTPRVGRTAA